MWRHTKGIPIMAKQPDTKPTTDAKPKGEPSKADTPPEAAPATPAPRSLAELKAAHAAAEEQADTAKAAVKKIETEIAAALVALKVDGKPIPSIVLRGHRYVANKERESGKLSLRSLAERVFADV